MLILNWLSEVYWLRCPWGLGCNVVDYIRDQRATECGRGAVIPPRLARMKGVVCLASKKHSKESGSVQLGYIYRATAASCGQNCSKLENRPPKKTQQPPKEQRNSRNHTPSASTTQHTHILMWGGGNHSTKVFKKKNILFLSAIDLHLSACFVWPAFSLFHSATFMRMSTFSGVFKHDRCALITGAVHKLAVTQIEIRIGR